VESAELLRSIGHQLLAEGLVADVARQLDRLAVRLRNVARDVVGIRLFRWKVVDRHIRAFARKRNGRGSAHAGIAAGDQGLAPGEAARALVAPFAVIRWRRHLAGEAGPRLLLLVERGLGIFR